jgi:invasion protein IalB
MRRTTCERFCALRGLKTNGKLQFKAANEKDVAVPVSFKGFGDAYDAMQK